MTDVISAILELPKQCKQAWDEASNITLPNDWKIYNVLVCAMGGSALGAHVVQSTANLKVPLQIVNGYLLPHWLDKNTLVVLDSYSGDTEEVLSCADQTEIIGCKVIGITTGGKLEKWLKDKKYPAYIFEPKYNATDQPRMGIGYGLFSLLAVFNNLSLLRAGVELEVSDAISSLSKLSKIFSNETKTKIVPNIKDKEVLIFAAEHLAGNAHIFANQLNETAKTLASWYCLPEANHHLLEGLKHPSASRVAIFLESQKYSDRIKKRFEITNELLEKYGFQGVHYFVSGKSLLSEALRCLLFSSIFTAYLAQENKEDPLAVPNVNYFKEKLG